MKQLCIIPCGKKKIWDKQGEVGPVQAKDAYIGIFHNLCEQYASAFFDQWVILSAKYGFLFPDDIVEGNYDVTFNMKSNEIITNEQLKNQISNKQLDVYQYIVVLTGKKYKPIVEGTFLDAKYIEFPLLGSKGIGHMQQLLKQAVAQNKALHSLR